MYSKYISLSDHCSHDQDLAVKKCTTWCPKLCINPLQSSSSSTLWFRPSEVADIFTVFSQYPDKTIKLIAGDTGRGCSLIITREIDVFS